MREAISMYGEPIPLPAWYALSSPVCAHPDMLTAKIGRSLLIHEGYREGRELLDRLEIPYLLSRAPVGRDYPGDVRLNCLAAEEFFLSNEAHVSREALALAEAQGLRRIHVRQGYAKCSCACAKNAIATMDRGIARAALRAGLDTLILDPFPIGIESYDTGFIGGASMLLDENTLGFFGRIEELDGYSVLSRFFESLGVRLVSLAQTPLFDYGGAVDIEI